MRPHQSLSSLAFHHLANLSRPRLSLQNHFLVTRALRMQKQLHNLQAQCKIQSPLFKTRLRIARGHETRRRALVPYMTAEALYPGGGPNCRGLKNGTSSPRAMEQQNESQAEEDEKTVLTFRSSQSHGRCREKSAGKPSTEPQAQWQRHDGSGMNLGEAAFCRGQG